MKQLRESIRSQFQSLPEEYAQRYARLRQARQVVQEEIAAALTPSLNQFLALPQTVPGLDDSYEGRRHIADLINSNLWMLNLAIKHPSSPNPAYFTLSPEDAHKTKECPLYIRVREGYRAARPARFSNWPAIQLIDDPPRIQHFGRWFEGGRGKPHR